MCCSFLLQPAAGQKFDDPLPDIQVSVMLNEALLDEEDAENCNSLQLRDVAMFALPPKWLLKDDEQPASRIVHYCYSASKL